MGLCLFLLWMLTSLLATNQHPPKCVRSYVWEELYMMSHDMGLTKAKVFQQDLLEWGKMYYIESAWQSYALDEEWFMKLWGQQKDLRTKKK